MSAPTWRAASTAPVISVTSPTPARKRKGLLDAEGDWQEEGPIRRELEDLFEDDSVTMQVFLDELVPGLTLSLNTSIIFRLNMPGRVMDSNAHETDGTTLVWEFSPNDAIQAPIEIYAESARSPDRQHT